MSIDNRQIRIFISSTFRDMKEERDYLNSIVFPQIRQYCEQRFLQFFPIDLRWGITEEDSRNGLVLSTCIEEVDHSRPFFIGILGSRYGWQPTVNDLNHLRVNVQKEKPWLEKEISEGASITEMEIEYGVLRKMDIPYASFFIRDEKVEIPQDFCEEQGSEAERHLENLKRRIRSQKKYPVTEYQSIQQFGDTIKQQILSMIEAEFPPTANNDWARALIQKQEYFFEKRSLFYCNIDNFYKPFDEWKEKHEKVLLYTGPSHDFRTTIVATWLSRTCNQRRFNYLYFDLSIGKSFGNPVDTFFTFLKLKDFEIAEKDKELIIVIDKDILDFVEADCVVRWMLSTDEHMRFIVISERMSKLSNFINFYYPHSEWRLTAGLSVEKQKEFIANFLTQYGKTLSPEQTEIAIKGEYSGDPSFLRQMLQVLLNYGEWDTLDNRIKAIVNRDMWFLYEETKTMFTNLNMKQEVAAYEIVLATIAILPGIKESVLLDWLEWAKAVWPIVRPHIMLLCNNNEDGLYFQFGDWYPMVRNVIPPKYLAPCLVNWLADNYDKIPNVAPCIIHIWGSGNVQYYDFSQDSDEHRTERELVEKNIIALAHSPELISQLSNESLSQLYVLDPLYRIPIADNTSPIFGVSVDELPLSKAIVFYQRLATIAYGHNRGKDTAYCYSEIARLMDKQEMPETILYQAKEKLAVGQAQKCIDMLMPLLKKPTYEEVSELLFVSSLQVVFDAYCQKGDFAKTKELLVSVSEKYDTVNLGSVPEDVLEPLLGILIQAAYCKCYYEETGLENLEKTLLAFEPFIKKRGIGHPYTYIYEMSLTNYYRLSGQITEMRRHGWLSEVTAVATYGKESFLWSRAAGMNHASHSKELKSIKKFGFMAQHGKRSFNNRFLDNIPSSEIDPDVLSALERENNFWA